LADTQLTPEELSARRVRTRRSALLLGAVALAFYIAFIVMSVVRS
jgi:hypothetical protein